MNIWIVDDANSFSLTVILLEVNVDGRDFAVSYIGSERSLNAISPHEIQILTRFVQ